MDEHIGTKLYKQVWEHAGGRPWTYWAGLFDGEGYIGFIRDKRAPLSLSILVQVNMKHKGIIDALYKEFGGYVRKEKVRPIYQWKLSGQKAEDFIKGILPFSLIKREQIELALRIRKMPASEERLKMNLHLMELKHV